MNSKYGLGFYVLADVFEGFIKGAALNLRLVGF